MEIPFDRKLPRYPEKLESKPAKIAPAWIGKMENLPDEGP